jgi:short-subunit dehydrogenase
VFLDVYDLHADAGGHQGDIDARVQLFAQLARFMATYSATKAFNLWMGEALWYELRKYHVDALAVSPGTTDTEFQRVAHTARGPIVAPPERVAETAMRALGRQPSVVDGRINSILAFAHRLVPRRLALTLSGGIIGAFHDKDRQGIRG